MESNEGVGCVNDICKEQAETEGNQDFDRRVTVDRRTTKVDVGKLREWLESVSDYAEIVIHIDDEMVECHTRKIVEAHRGPKTNLHPHGTFVLSVR